MKCVLTLFFVLIASTFVTYVIVNIFYSLEKEKFVIKHKEYACSNPGTEINKIQFNLSLETSEKTIMFQSINHCNRIKKEGGDFWWVIVNGPVSFSMLLKNNGGLYYGKFSVYIAGSYSINMRLEFTNNDGMKDPPKGFYNAGNCQGYNQNMLLFTIDNDYLMVEKIFQFNVKPQLTQHNIAARVEELWDNQAFCIINSAYGYWINNTYIPIQGYIYVNNSIKREKIIQNLQLKQMQLGGKKPTLMLCGDSIQRYFYNFLVKNSKLCEFYVCELTYTHLYVATPENECVNGKDYNRTKFLGELRNVILSEPMRNNNSVFLLNFGLHPLRSINMSDCKMLFDELLLMLRSLKTILKSDFPKIIWKTTTPTFNTNSRNRNYIRKQRTMEWNKYCLEKSCEVNLPVLDVFWMAGSYPGGTFDTVHYADIVFVEALFLCDARSKSQARVQIFNIKEDIQPVAHIGQGLFQAPHGICVTKSNKTLVTDVERREVFIIEDDGYHASVFGGEGHRPGQFLFPHDVVFDEVHKRIIVSDTLNHRLQIFTESGRFMDIVEYDKHGKRLFSYPTSLKFNNDNHLVVCDNGANSLQILNQDMQSVKNISLGDAQKPSAVTILPLGKMCIASSVQSTLTII